METDFRIHHSFWRSLNPFSWTQTSLLVTFIVSYLIIILAYFIAGFLPTSSAFAIDASSYNSNSLSIPSISLETPTLSIKPEGDTLPTPIHEVGEYSPSENKVFLYAHSTSAFQNLADVNLDDIIYHSGKKYIVTSIETKKKENVDMHTILSAEQSPTLVLMTCVGFPDFAGEYPSRLIVTAREY